MSLLIRNGEIVTAGSRLQADIYVENETITRIGKHLEAPPNTDVIDATGKLVFPGFIDPHVHIYLPFMATFAKDTHETGSIAALIGGTTTYIEMCCPNRNDDALEGYQLWKSKAEGKSACDYAFHMSVTKFVKETELQLREIVADGTASFKIFLAYKNFFGVDDGEMYQTLELAKRLGVIVTAHCENAELVARLQQKLLAEGKTGPEWHEPSRPESVEAEGTGRFATFLENTGATGYVVHLSCEKALHAALRAKARGVKIHVESVLPHFLLDKSYAERPGVEGMKSRNVAAFASEAQPGRALECAGGRFNRYGGDGSLPVRHRAEVDGQGFVRQYSQWNSGNRRSRESAVCARRETRKAEPGSLCGCGEHPGGEAFWTVPAQRHNCSG